MTQLRALFEGIADAQLLHALYKLALELVGDFLRHNEALGGDAGLSIVLDAGVDCGGDCGIEVGARHHDEGIAAA